jgi:hypothetical protein
MTAQISLYSAAIFDFKFFTKFAYDGKFLKRIDQATGDHLLPAFKNLNI